MTTTSDILEGSGSEQRSTLPPIITVNPREKVEICDVSIKEIIPICDDKEKVNELYVLFPPRKPSGPHPLHPLSITWCPSDLYFEIDEKEVIKRLWVLNSCSRSIYIHCCGLWNEAARMGAGWQCYPRTRFLLAPGLKGELFVKAMPRNYSPIPHAQIGLQLAASHMRDCVTGFFFVPIQVKYLNYIPPYFEEGE